MKLKKILTTSAIMIVAFIAGCKKDTFVESPGVCPVVVSTNPANTATGISSDKVIEVTFNEEINPATITQESFTIQGLAPVEGSLSYNGTTAYFIPSVALASNSTYTGRITTSVKDLKGNALQTDYVWTFSTGVTLSPAVISTDPVNNALAVVLNKTVSATFSMSMDSLTINANTFTLKQGSVVVPGTVSYSNMNAFFNPANDLTPNTVYTATLTTGAKSVTGTPLTSDYVWTFTTGSITAPTIISTDPANSAVSVPLNKNVSAIFSMLMDPSTINASSFTLKQGTTLVAGVISYTGATLTFTPSSALSANSTYTATITTAAKNVAGTPIANNYVWTFTTISTTAPTVISTDPVSNATGVVLNKIITANFSTPMNPLTITSSTFTLKKGTTVVAGGVSYSGTTASFKPSVNLLSGSTYTATITTGAKNLAGTGIVNNYVWTFSTGIITAPVVTSTDPVNLATGVVLNKTISANFSMVMNRLTINSTTFILKQGAASVAGTVSYAGTTASFIPTANLLSNTTYTASITTGAMNVAGVPLANNYIWSFTTKPTLGAPFVNLNSVERFGIIAGVGVSNNAGFSEIHNMDVGISPGVRSSITGFPPAIIVNGAIYASDDIAPPGVPAMLSQAKLDLTNAYLFAEGATSPAPATVAGDQGGKTLAPGIYKSTSTLLIQSGDLTLDAQGDVNAVWIFQVAAAFTTIGGAGGNVILSGGAQAKNVFWQTGSSATIGDYTSFKGNVLALTSITMNSHATAVGRMLARNGSVVMTSTNIINRP